MVIEIEMEMEMEKGTEKDKEDDELFVPLPDRAVEAPVVAVRTTADGREGTCWQQGASEIWPELDPRRRAWSGR